jgi:serine/threonine protein kinase
MGLSKRIEDDVNGASTTVKGTPGFLAPELLGFGDVDPRRADPFATDIWCLGEMAFRLLCGKAAFASFGMLRQYQLGTTSLPNDVLQEVGASALAIEFMGRALVASPPGRFKASQAMDHQWIKSAAEDEPFR